MAGSIAAISAKCWITRNRCDTRRRINRNERIGMSEVFALVSADKPIIRIYGGEEYVEIAFETLDDAAAAVEQLNPILKKATGIAFVTRGKAVGLFFACAGFR
jgi:hypothetical protein